LSKVYYSPDVRPLAWALPRLLRAGGRGFVFGLTRREALGDLKLALAASLELDVVEVQYGVLVERLYKTEAARQPEGDRDDDASHLAPPFATRAGLQACRALACEAVGIGNGAGAGAGMDCGLSVAPEDVLFADASGRWVQPGYRGGDGKVPTARVTCLECEKRAVPREAPPTQLAQLTNKCEDAKRPRRLSDMLSDEPSKRRGD